MPAPQPRDTAADAYLAAELEADVTVEHIGEVYATALLGAAESAGRPADAVEELESFVRDVLGPLPQLDRILSSAFVSHEEKGALLDRLLGDRASELLLNFLKVLSRHGRLDALRAIARQARALYDRKRGVIPVEFVTAAPVSPPLLEQVRQRLQDLLGGEPHLKHRVQPGLIGGAVVRVGDTIYDGSIANQLEKLRQQMIDRSVHEIQSRRDRFRPPAGN
jgi:F-type H+-transporting ATPase subunit delta